MTQSTELLPCPFCGASGHRLTQAQIFADVVNIWSVECLDCGAERASDESQAEADQLWNTRIEHSTPDRYAVQVDAAQEWPAFISWWQRTIPHKPVPSVESHYFDVWMARARSTTTPEPTDPAGVSGVEKLLTLIETAHEHGDECAIIEQAAKVRAALRPARDKTRTALQAIKEGEER